MQVKIIKNHDHWLTPTVTQAFRADTTVKVPTKTAQALIAAKVAVKSPTAKED